MPSRIEQRVLILVLAALMGGAAVGQAVAGGEGPASPPVQVEGVWARPAGVGMNSAVYMAVANRGPEVLEIVAAATDVAAVVEMHETVLDTRIEDGRLTQIMRMQRIDSLKLAAGETVTLRPGGLHIMLIGLVQPLEEGDVFSLVLEFRDGRRLELEVPVTQGAQGGHGSHAGDGHHAGQSQHTGHGAGH